MKPHPPTRLRTYQRRAIEYLVANPIAALHIGMSLGKTVITLTALQTLFDSLQIKGALVIAPRRVAECVWAQEERKWAHLSDLKICVLRGRSKSLLERDLLRPFHVWVLNYEALPWLLPVLNKLFLAQNRWLPFDTLVFDEITRVKNPDGKRAGIFHAKDKNGGKLVHHFHRRIGLTGTPAPNGYWDLFGQYLMLDDGRALGDLQQTFAERFFVTDPRNGRRYMAKGAREKIEALIAPITLTMRAEDYLELPPYVFNDIWVDLPPKTRERYDELEKEMFTEMDHGTVEVFNAMSLETKCRQLANGTILDTESGTAHPVHSAKLEALDEIVEEAATSPVLVSYIYRADMERIRNRYRKTLSIGYLGPGVGMAEATNTLDHWNSGDLALLLLHHQSGRYGLNLQTGGHQIVWFGLDWPPEGWLQLNARLRRPGQASDRVIIHCILARNTIDEVVLERLTHKTEDQNNLQEGLTFLDRNRDIIGDDTQAAVRALQDYRARRGNG